MDDAREPWIHILLVYDEMALTAMVVIRPPHANGNRQRNDRTREPRAAVFLRLIEICTIIANDSLQRKKED